MEYQNIGIRLAALLIDYLLIGSFYLLSAFVAMNLMASGSSLDIDKFVFLFKIFFHLFFVVILLYLIIMEGFFGWSLGKRALGLQVVQEDGSPCSLMASFIRNVFRLVDWLPVCYLLGVILIWTSPLRQRLGDRLARTVVVKFREAPEHQVEELCESA